MVKFILLVGDLNQFEIEQSVASLYRSEKEKIFQWKTDYAHFIAILSQDEYAVSTIDSSIFEITTLNVGHFKLNAKQFDYFKNFKSNDSAYDKDIYSNIDNTDGFGVIFDNIEKSIYLLTDPNFRYVGYYAKRNDVIIISTEMKGIYQMDPTFELDENGIYSYIALGGFYGNVSLFKEMYPLQAGTIYEISENIVKTFHKKKYPKNYDYSNGKSYAELTEHYAIVFADTVAKYIEEGANYLYLSGGLDSRMVLNAIKNRKYNINSISMGNRSTGSADQRYAEKVAAVAEIDHLSYNTRPEDIIEHANYQAFITEGSSALGTAILTGSSRFIRDYNEPLKFINGQPGDLNYGGTWGEKLSKYPPNKKSKWGKLGLAEAESIAKSSIALKLLERLFTKDEYKILQKQLYQQIQDDWEYFDNVEDDELRTELYAMNNRVRKGLVTTVGEDFQLRFPFMDNEVLLQSLIIPPELRKERKFQYDVMYILDKELTKLPCTSIQPVSTQKKIDSWTKRIIKMLPGIRYFARKYIYKKIAKTKETTYLPMNTWFREDEPFRNFMLEHLINFDRRGYLEEAIIMKLIDEHLAQENNHINILSKIVNLELVIAGITKGNN